MSIVRHWTPLALLAAMTAVLPAQARAADAAQPTIDRHLAVLQALDKITARTSEMTVPVGDLVTFGTLDITVHACRSTPPDQTPEDAVFLEIVDQPPGSDAATVFSGWMFASSPAVSAMEHAVYDLRLVDCVDIDDVRVPAQDDGQDPALQPPAGDAPAGAPFESPALRPVIPEEGTR